MTVARSLGTGILVVLLIVSLVGANGVVAAERTVLSANFVKTTIDESGGYDVLQDAVVEAASEQVAGDGTSELPVSPTEIVESAVTPSYLETQTEANVDRVYGYLHGDRDELVIALDLEPVKENVVKTVENRIENMSLLELTDLVGSGDTAAAEVQGVSLDIGLIGTMAANQSSYQETRETFRERIRQAALNRIVNDTMESASNDELLALVIDDYDPNAYTEQEKEQMVEDREDEIRTAVEQQIEQERGDELDAAIEKQLAAYNEEIKSQLESSVQDSGGDVDPALVNATADLAKVGVDGLTTDMSYAEFSSQIETEKADLAEAIVAVTEDRLAEEIPDRIDLTEQMGADTRQQLQTVRQAVGIADILQFALPLLAILLIAGIYLLTKSIAVTAVGAGIGLFVSGLLGFGIASTLPPRLRAGLPADLPGAMASLVTTLIDRVFGLLQTQSLVLLVVGILALGLGVAIWYDLLPTDTTEAT